MSGGQFSTRVRENIRSLPLSSFAFVMATGIVSVGLEGIGLGQAARVMLLIAALGYLSLVLLLGVRLLRWRHLVWGELRNPARSFGSFTFVAGTNVLGVSLALQGQPILALGLLLISLVPGVALGYLVPWLAVLGGGPPPLKLIDGTWFIWVVAAQSIAVLSGLLAPEFPTWSRGLSTVAVIGWSTGTVLYTVVATLVIGRLMSQPVGPADMNQSYWITMGAMAITIVGGSGVVSLDPGISPMVAATRDLIAGSSVIMWCFASALIPVLLAVGYWRHIVHRIPLHYRSAQWSVVFPLGMYAVACRQLGAADGLPLASLIGGVWVWAGVLAWLLTFATMLVALRSGGKGRQLALPAA